MRFESMMATGGLKDALLREPDVVRLALAEVHPAEIATWVADLPTEDAVALIRVLDEQVSARVLDALPLEHTARVLEHLDTDLATKLITEMAADERTDVLQMMRPEVAEPLLGRLQETEPQVAEEVRELAAYPPETAGGLMTPEFAAMPPEMKAWQAIDELRRLAQERKAETISYIYVVAYGKQLVGVVSLRDLILSDPGQALSDIMTENVVRVAPEADQEEVAQCIARYNLSAVPVIDSHGQMLGVVTVDDVVDVVIEEATEDAQRMGAVEPIEDTYFKTDFFTFIRKRVVWLVALFFGELLTTSVMRSYEAELATMMDLVLFIPLIISSGGNSGSQSSSLIIRALAVGEVRPRDWWRVISRELGIGISLGLILGVVGFVRAWFVLRQHDPISMPLAVGGSIVAVVSLGTTVGSLFPLLMRRLGLDPAVSSTPFIASLVDVLGLLAYFTLSRFIVDFAF